MQCNYATKNYITLYFNYSAYYTCTAQTYKINTTAQNYRPYYTNYTKLQTKLCAYATHTQTNYVSCTQKLTS